MFVQISDENLHHVRELMDEVFGAENFVASITVQKTQRQTTELLSGKSTDYLVWYGKDIDSDQVSTSFIRLRKHGGDG